MRRVAGFIELTHEGNAGDIFVCMDLKYLTLNLPGVTYKQKGL